MEKKNKWLLFCLSLLLATSLVMGMPLKAQACGGGGGGTDHHGSADSGSYGHMGQGYGGQGSSGHMGQGQSGPGMTGRSGAPAGSWSQPAAPGNTGSGHVGGAGSVDHSRMGHGGSQ